MRRCPDSSATRVVLDNNGQNGFGVSAATGANGFPLASYTAAPTGGSPTSLRVASCTNAACSSPTLTTLVASNVSTTQRTSIAVGPDGLPVITYSDTTGHLHLAHCSNIQCTAAATTLVDSRATLVDASVTIGVDGLPGPRLRRHGEPQHARRHALLERVLHPERPAALSRRREVPLSHLEAA